MAARRDHPSLEPVWRALASTTRRRMLDALYERPLTTGALSERFGELSRFAVMQHLRVLEEANLVVAQREGRHRINHLNPVPIQQIYDRWVSRFQQPWAEVLVSLKDDIERGPARGAATRGKAS